MSRSKRGGISKLELMVVVGICAILTSMFMPAVQKVRGPSYRTECIHHLQQIALSLQNFESVGQPGQRSTADEPANSHSKFFPKGCLGPGKIAEERMSWIVAVLPYLEQQRRFEQFDLKKPYGDNLKAAEESFWQFICPVAHDYSTFGAMTDYIAMAGIGRDAAERPRGSAGNGFMGYDRRTSVEMITDGTSHTIAVIETWFDPGPWARGGPSTLRGLEPGEMALSKAHPRSVGHSDGFPAAMADASVRIIASSIDRKKLTAAITIAADDKFELD